ncbi:MAG TPA: serine/threonine-protein kinase, partial [Thermoanaerobaculia bacterium]|nr:serine/threonine-protein kinase [Thermoanaerobaculia bacterium]
MIGRQIGSYTVTGHLGSGGMGDVYRARDTRLGRDVAVKVLPAHVPDKNEGLARFEREARIVSGLNHPHILTIYEIGQVQLPGELGATHYIVTEFVDGVTMREAMNSREHDLRQMLEYLVQVVDALRKAHAAGVVHRDLKPENIMFTRDGYAKVLDFGLAKMFSPQNGERAANTFHTERGMTVGTIGYMAPEQIQGKPVDHRTDIFAFGCLLYELLAGDVPFAANDLVNVLYKITSAKPPPLGPHVDAALRQVVRRCLEKDPADRFQNVGEIAEVLRIVIARTGRGETAANRERLRTPSATRATSRVRVVAVMPFVNGSG